VNLQLQFQEGIISYYIIKSTKYFYVLGVYWLQKETAIWR